MSVLEARAAVLCVLSMLQQQFRDVGSIAHDVTFITGRGAGSEGGEPVLRREVAALLQRLHLRLPEEGPTDNPGRIVIPRQVGATGGSMLLRAGLEMPCKWCAGRREGRHVLKLPLLHVLSSQPTAGGVRRASPADGSAAAAPSQRRSKQQQHGWWQRCAKQQQQRPAG